MLGGVIAGMMGMVNAVLPATDQTGTYLKDR